MFKKICTGVLNALLICLAATTVAFSQDKPTATDTASTPGYATVNGAKIYYEIRGKGEPLVLLHGGLGSIGMYSTSTLAALSATRKVIAIDMPGHGHSTGIDRPMSYASLADDIAGVIKQLGLGSVELAGYSLGGGTALQLTIRHPELVKKLVVISSPYKRKAWHPEILAGMDHMDAAAAEAMKPSPMYQLYASIAPDKNKWVTLVTQTAAALRNDYDWSAGVKAIKVPVLLVFGDADAIPTAEMPRFYELLGGGQRDAGWDNAAAPVSSLAILPQTSHYNILQSPLLTSCIVPFLQKPVK